MEKVMSKIGKTAINTYRYAAQGAGKIARELKLKAQMSNDKAQIKEIYENIGKNIYEKYLLREKIDIEAELAQDCTMIDILANEVEDIREELLSLKDLKQCPRCYYEIDVDYHFCPNCGLVQELTPEGKQNDGPATIETTSEADTILKAKNRQDMQEDDIEETLEIEDDE